MTDAFVHVVVLSEGASFSPLCHNHFKYLGDLSMPLLAEITGWCH